MDFNEQLKNSLHYSFIHRQKYINGNYGPQLVLNKPKEKKTVFSVIQGELEKCETFSISVAFVTQSGIGMLKTTLSDAMDKGVKGRVLISPYLGFNDPNAMHELLKFTNIEVRITPSDLNMHAKCYLFTQKELRTVVLGSSNLTANALRTNFEWNIKLTSAEHGDFIKTMEEEYNSLWEQSVPLTVSSIKAYDLERKANRESINFARIPMDNNPMSYMPSSNDDTYDKFRDRAICTREKVMPNTMQEKALLGLAKARYEGKKRALVISATGTGKTFLSAFDVRNYEPKKMLYIVHREQILVSAMRSYREVLGCKPDEMLLYKSGDSLEGKRFVFTTIQTLSKDKNLNSMGQEEFDYILIDEVHKAAAPSYKKVIDYFKPDFLLGMTATPERTNKADRLNVYEIFDFNVAYEIRLQDALEQNMLCPFLYFGVKDIQVNGELLGDTQSFSDLSSDDRVNHIIEKLEFYSPYGEINKGLIFCSTRQEAQVLSEKFNQKGIKAKALTGEDRQEVRERVTQELKSGEIEYIFTVDIFNEGIDIPELNQVVLLRNTQSSIIFIQQLGRGLRKYKDKEYVTIIDFIGNYKNNYLIPIALYGDYSMNKEEYRKKLTNREQLVGISTINFEKVAKEQIFNSIKTTKYNSGAIIRNAYLDLKERLGRVPKLKEFLLHNSFDPVAMFCDIPYAKNYGELIDKIEKSSIYTSNSMLMTYLTNITREFLHSKRPHELVLLKELIYRNGTIKIAEYLSVLSTNNISLPVGGLRAIERVLTGQFYRQVSDKLMYNHPLIVIDGDTYRLSENLYRLCYNCDFESKNESTIEGLPTFRELFLDTIEAGLSIVKRYTQWTPQEPLIKYKRYSRKEVCLLLDWVEFESNINGYMTKNNSTLLFITYHKDDTINSQVKYDDKFINERLFQWESRSRRYMHTNEVKVILEHKQLNNDVHVFVKRDGSEGSDFYYLGLADYIDGTAVETKKIVKSKDNNGQDTVLPVVAMKFELKESIPDHLFEYFNN